MSNVDKPAAPSGILVMYHAEQNMLRLYLTYPGCWSDMISAWESKREHTPLVLLMEYGWELVGEL